MQLSNILQHGTFPEFLALVQRPNTSMRMSSRSPLNEEPYPPSQRRRRRRLLLGGRGVRRGDGSRTAAAQPQLEDDIA